MLIELPHYLRRYNPTGYELVYLNPLFLRHVHRPIVQILSQIENDFLRCTIAALRRLNGAIFTHHPLFSGVHNWIARGRFSDRYQYKFGQFTPPGLCSD